MSYDIPLDDSTALNEKSILQSLIRESGAQNIVEIGTHRGLTTCYLAEAALETGGHVTTYDPYDYDQNAMFAKYPQLPITYHRAKGIDCDLTNIDFLFVDGYHEKDRVLAEIAHFLPRLSPNALMVFHDTKEQNKLCDVRGALEEAKLPVEYIDTENGLAIYRA